MVNAKAQAVFAPSAPEIIAQEVYAFSITDADDHEPPRRLALEARPESNDAASINGRRSNLDSYRQYLKEEIELRKTLYRRSDNIHTLMTWIGIAIAVAYAMCHTAMANGMADGAVMSSVSVIITTSLASMWKVCNILSPRGRLHYQIYALSVLTHEKISRKLNNFFVDNVITHEEYKNLEADFDAYKRTRAEILRLKTQLPSTTLALDVI